LILQPFFELSLCIFLDECHDVLVEILGVPLENAAHIKGVPLQVIACRIILAFMDFGYVSGGVDNPYKYLLM
jgi:hypothetical protein